MIKTVNFRTLGCRLNHAESDAIEYELQKNGLQIVNSENPADLTIINSCAVTQQAEAKTRGAIAAARRISPDGKIAVIGCYSQMSPEMIAELKGVDLVLGNSEKYTISEVLDVLEKGQREIHVSPNPDTYTFPANGIISKGSHTRAHMKIQEGCDYHCSYCIIPLLRGPSRSRDFQACIAEATQLVENGFKEIVLSGINIGTYSDHDKDLAGLVKGLLDQTKIQRLRISSIEPDLISDNLIYLMKTERRFCRHFHIPLQHGSDDVLAGMRRRYRVDYFVELVEKIAETIPGVCIGTDILVGFPGETDKHFREMYDLLSRLPLAYFHVFRYSARPGTKARDLDDSVSVPLKKERSRELRKLSTLKRMQYLEKFDNELLKVLFEQKTKLGLYRGLSDNYITVNVRSKHQVLNTIQTVRVKSVDNAEVVGEVIIG